MEIKIILPLLNDTYGLIVPNHTFEELNGTINQVAWANRDDGTILLKFFINNTIGETKYNELGVIKNS